MVGGGAVLAEVPEHAPGVEEHLLPARPAGGPLLALHADIAVRTGVGFAAEGTKRTHEGGLYRPLRGGSMKSFTPNR